VACLSFSFLTASDSAFAFLCSASFYAALAAIAFFASFSLCSSLILFSKTLVFCSFTT